MECLSAAGIRAGLKTELIGREIVFHSCVTSTNDEARRLAEAGEPEGSVVVADYQSAGRGRQRRRWQAPLGASLLLSVVFRPSVSPDRVQRLTMTAGLAVVDAIEGETGIRAGLKWPNDIVFQGGKLGGILTEIGLASDHIDYAVVGIGLNVNLDPGSLTGKLMMRATSLSAVLGREVRRLPLLCALLHALDERYCKSFFSGELQHEWTAHLTTLGQPVTVSLPDRVLEGVAEGVNAGGALLVRTAGGQLVPVVAGDVTVSV